MISTFGINLGLDLKGGLQIVLQVMTDEAVRVETARSGPLKPAAEEAIREQSVEQAMRVIDKRLNALGVGEMSIQRYGDRQDRQLLLEWPGFERGSPPETGGDAAPTAQLGWSGEADCV